MKTTLIQEKDVERSWYVVDAAGKPVGRLAVEIAKVLRGKNKPTWAPHIDSGDFVVVINAAEAKLTGRKEEQKIYEHYTGYPNGLKRFSAAQIREKNPERMIHQAVRGMLPKNHLSRRHLRRLRVFAGAEHPHQAQKPEPLEVL